MFPVCAGPVVISSLLLEVVRSFYSYCREMIGEDSPSGSGLAGNQLARLAEVWGGYVRTCVCVCFVLLREG